MMKRGLCAFAISLFFVSIYPALLLAQNGILGVLPVGSQPIAVAINARTNQAFVLSRGSQEVFVVDLRSRSVGSKYRIGGVPAAIAVNPQTNQVVVAGLDSIVTIIDQERGEIVATVPVGKAPSRVAIDTKKNTALVTNFSSRNMAVIDLSTHKVVERVPLKNGPVGIAVLDDKRIAVVAHQYDMELLQINLDKNSVEKRLYIGHYLSDVAANPETGVVLVGNPTNSGILLAYDPAQNSVQSALPVGAGPLSIAIYPKRNVALAGGFDSDTVSLVDLKVSQVIRSVGVEKGPSGIAIHPDTGIAVIANRLSDSVTFLDVEILLAAARTPSKRQGL